VNLDIVFKQSCYTFEVMKTNLVFSPRYKTPLSDFGFDKPFALDRGEMVLKRLGEDIGAPVPYLSLETGLAANLGGGYHHAFPDQGRGYCPINDIAIAIRHLQKTGKIKKALIVDLDFHQGDGTAVTFKNDDSVFTFSVHSEEGWPEVKQQSDLDIPIKEIEKDQYLSKTEAGLKLSLSKFAPDMVIYVGGSDPYEKDVLPGTSYLRLPLAVMKARDELVIDTFADRGISLSTVFAGGYGPDVWEVHYLATRRLLERSGLSFGKTFSCC
jgi:acetoin utilization deacetylase AcuC-like enzyme